MKVIATFKIRSQESSYIAYIKILLNIIYKSTKLCCFIIVPRFFRYSIILLRNLNNYEGNSHSQEENRTGGAGVGALKSGLLWVRSGVATWASPFGVVAELQVAGSLCWGGGCTRGFGLTKEKKNPFKNIEISCTPSSGFNSAQD